VSPGSLSATFNFQAFPGAAMAFDGGTVLIGTPKTSGVALDKLVLYVDNTTAMIRRATMIDGRGNRTRFDFSNAQFARAPPPAFIPPPGTSLVTGS